MSLRSEIEFRAMHGEPGTASVVSVTDSSAATASLVPGKAYVITSAIAFHISVGADPTATTSDTFWPAGIPYYIVMNVDNKIAFVKASGEDDGSVFVTPLGN